MRPLADTNNTTKPKVLLVDDQTSNLLAFEALLENFDIELLQATSGEDALRILTKEKVALVLLDVQMPGMDGYEVAEMMQLRSQTRTTPIIFVSAINRTMDHILQGYHSGAMDFLTKPIDERLLQSKVKVFLELHENAEKLKVANRTLENTLQQLERIKQHNEVLLNSIGQGVISLNTEGNITYANPAAQTLLAMPNSIVGCRFSQFTGNDQSTHTLQAVLAACHAGKTWNGTIMVSTGDTLFPAYLTATPLIDSNQHTEEISITFHDASEQQRREEALREETECDPLTQLCNRRGLERILQQRLAAEPETLALLYIDLDKFKPVNDELGHQCGDAVLQELGKRFSQTIRHTDVVARIGGDEFCIVIASSKPQHTAAAIAEKVIELAEQPFTYNGSTIEIGASIGIALPLRNSNPESLLHQADEAMYKAKRSGGMAFKVA